MTGPTDGGWIKLHRRFLKSAVWQNPTISRFWVWILLKATHTPITVMTGYAKVNLLPGQLVFTRPLVCKETGLTDKRVRLCLAALSDGDSAEIGLKKGRHFSVLTVLKWDDYQICSDNEGRQKAEKGPTKGRLFNRKTRSKEDQGAKIAPIDVDWNGVNLVIPDVLMAKYRAKFSRLDIPAIVIDAERWLLKNPAKAAGYKSFDLFLNNWLSGEEEKRRKRDGEDYELSGDSLAAAMECARLHGRAANE